MLRFVLLKAAAQESVTEVVRELAELVEQLVDIVRGLQSQSPLPESGPDDERSAPSVSMVGSPGGESACGGRGWGQLQAGAVGYVGS